MTAIGEVLTAADPELPALRVLAGTENGQWVVQEDDEFGAPRLLEPDEYAAYGVHSAPQKGTDEEGWRRLGRSTQRRPVLPERQKSPEQHFRDGTATPVTAQRDGVVFVP